MAEALADVLFGNFHLMGDVNGRDIEEVMGGSRSEISDELISERESILKN